MVEELWAGRYRRERLLGHGAMGDVWAAFDVLLDRPVAIKSISGSRTDPDDQQRMSREARVAARIAHPNAVAVHDLVVVDGRPNLVMEYVDSDTLADRIKRFGRLDPQRVAAIGAAVADALAEAHRLGIVHRDIKPANILITPRGVPKLADFGIARVAGDPNMTATGMMVGTPAYMAPEVVHGGAADARSDVWALGVTLYAALEGGPPFVLGPHDEPMVVLGRVLHATVHPPSCDGALADAVTAMLDRDPSRRPTAHEAAELLRTPRTSGPAALETSRLPGRPGPPAWSEQTRTDVRPGPEPVLPGVWSASGDDAADVGGRAAGGHAGRVLAVVAAVVLVLAAATAGVLLYRSHDHGSPAAQGGGPTATTPGPTTGATTASTSTPTPTDSTVTSAPPSTQGSTSSGSPTTSTVVVDGTTYTGPGGVTVVGPQGWTRDTSGGNNNVIDYDAPGSSGFVHGLAFQIGIGNPHALPTVQAEARGAKRYLRSVETGLTFPQTQYGTFLGAPSVVIEYVGTNSAGVERHGIEQLWLSDGVTREVIVSGRSGQWSTAEPVFDQLVATCKVG
ncbi:serine/threonine-protein kinase [Jatrophihabitans endophyticus]|uniref:serine/threonine-protein kinase n=1 Tax=Jatrophihabitans endophyticus TaxID=1206085 RepID=UPI0019F0A3FC|nr:serine/threonine-protein kinase [Jatrophihabitans endophyticus]MBE7186802.1 serine/threonine protein kinase [Jatrophihabitans endophyticus]